MADGRLNKCKSCCKQEAIKNREKNIEYYREYDRKRGNRQGHDYVKEYRNKYPKKHKAHNIVGKAIKSGKLFKEPCEECSELKGVHAHHDDYDKPLNVRWLCPAHHRQWHEKHGEAKNPK